MMKTTETIRADIFVVPNGSFKVSEKTFECARSNLYEIYSANHERLDGEFKDQEWVQVWFVTRGSGNNDSNWTDHTIDGFKELKGWRPMSQYLPKSIFNGHKEGDIVSVILPICKSIELAENSNSYADMRARVKVELCLSQHGYRYERFGTFEEVLARV